MSYQTIISVEDLNRNLSNEDWFIFDCRFLLKDPNGGLNKFNQGHIPGAQFADMDKDLASSVTKSSGRHPLPNPDLFIEKLRAWGVNNNSQIICYDDMSGAFSARMWWLLNWMGHKDVAVLDGGIEKWTAIELPLETKVKQRLAGTFTGSPNNEMWVDVNFVQQQLQQGNINLLDARSAERFTAKDKKTDPVPGHVPGAVNYPFAGNLDKQGVFLSANELSKRFATVFAEYQTDQIINMCGSGVTACHNLLALHIAGFPMPR
ncbi:MAG: sulfurtransferase, partial [Gammaproteobacteria bacterium]